MARIVKEDERKVKRTEIIDAAQRLIYTKGYEQMTIQDILGELQISKGAFYHYFDSKGALLEALIERMQEEATAAINPIIQDPALTAQEKLQRFFDAAARWKSERKGYILSLLRVWYADDNAIVRHKVQSALVKDNVPMLNRIIQQGIREGTWNNAYPEQAGMVVLTLIQSLGEAFVDLLLSPGPRRTDQQEMECIVASYSDAIERVLGAEAGSLRLVDAATVKEWVDVIGEIAPVLE